MPYFITDSHPECSGVAVVKEDGELFACHMDEDSAVAQMVAVSLAEGIEPGGMYEGPEMRVALEKDKFTTEAEAVARAKVIGCAGFHTMTDDGETIYMPCDTHAAYEAIVGGSGYRQESEPAPPEDQIEGSQVNEPGSASGPGGDIKLSEATQTALRNKVRDHNDQMAEDDKPDYTRTTYGQLAAVYRRGSGAYSTSHRPGVSRAAWSMARVNAFLYLLRNGRPENAAYISDNDLLPEGHPKSTRSEDLDAETRQVDLTPPAYMRASARRGLEWHSEGLSGPGLQDSTVREARALARGSVTAEKWVRIRAFLARHMVDFDAPAASVDHEDFPSPGVVAISLWGGGTTKRSAQRAMDYADGVIGRIEKENEGRVKGQALSKMETRVTVTDFEVREEEDGMHLTGYAARFNEASEPLPFREYIAPGAFKRSLQSRNDVKLLWNHDSSIVLGSTRAGTLKLSEDDQGLRVSATLPETQAGKDAKVLINRGDVTGFSFGFTVPSGGDSWNEDGSERTLNAVRLMEVSTGVAFPAYPSTNGTALVRGLDKVAERAEVDADALADALLKIENGEDISTDDRQLITTVLDKLAPLEKVEDVKGDLDMLALKKKKLELLMGL